jgi:hypothetical protein
MRKEGRKGGREDGRKKGRTNTDFGLDAVVALTVVVNGALAAHLAHLKERRGMRSV